MRTETAFGGDTVDVCSSILQTADGGFALAGSTTSFGMGGADFWLVKTGRDPVSVSESKVVILPVSLYLAEPFPNPFNSSAVLSYSLPSPGLVSLNLFDLSGRRIRTLADCMMQAGDYRQTLNAVDMPSGSYFIRLNADGESAMKKVMLVK